MAVVIPSFRYQNPRPGANAPSSGAVFATAASGALTEVARGAASSLSQKQHLNELADQYESNNPQIAALIRSQATNIPLISDTSAGGSGGGGRGGSGFGGAFGAELLKFEINNQQAEDQHNRNIAMSNLSHQQGLERLGASFANSMQLAGAQHSFSLQRLEAADALRENPANTPEGKANQERAIAQLEAENARRDRELARLEGGTNAGIVQSNLKSALSGFGQTVKDNKIVGEPELSQSVPDISGTIELPGMEWKDFAGRASNLFTPKQIHALYYGATEGAARTKVLDNLDRGLRLQGHDFKSAIGEDPPVTGSPQEAFDAYRAKRDEYLTKWIDRKFENSARALDLTEALGRWRNAAKGIRR